MKIYITKGIHWTVPGEPEYAAADRATADASAVDLVNLLRESADLPALAPGADWQAGLVEAQRARIAFMLDGPTADAVPDDELADSSEGDVWVYELDLPGVADAHGDLDGAEAMAEPLPLATMQLYRALADRVLAMTDSQELPQDVADLVMMIEDADPSGEPATTMPIDVRAIAVELVDTLAEVINVHVYGDDDVIPADCQLVELVERACRKLGLPPREFETVNVWAVGVSFIHADGTQGEFSTTVTADTREEALSEALVTLLQSHPGARHGAVSICLEAQGSEG